MVPANKILTVAYGTFSCTLEGFDDPFSTMTDIAEYFRDLAAEDRFFGAEPPTPDMAMLRTIAEARARQTVEAHPAENGVMLRPAAAAGTDLGIAGAASSKPEPAAEAPRPAVEEAPAASDPSADAVNAVMPTEATPVVAVEDTLHEAPEAAKVEPVDVDVAAIEDAASDAAAKLARIRDVVEADRQAVTDYSEDLDDDFAVLANEAASAESAPIGAETGEDARPVETTEVEAPADAAVAAIEEPQAIEPDADDAAAEPLSDEADAAAETDDAVPEAEPVEVASQDEDAGAAPDVSASDGEDDVVEAVLPDDAATPGETATPEAEEPEVGSEGADAVADASGTEEATASEVEGGAIVTRRIRVRRVRRTQVEAATAEAGTEASDPVSDTAPEDAGTVIGEAAPSDDLEAADVLATGEDDDLMAELAEIEADLAIEADDAADRQAGKTEEAEEAEEAAAPEADAGPDELEAELSAMLAADDDDAKPQASEAPAEAAEEPTAVEASEPEAAAETEEAASEDPASSRPEGLTAEEPAATDRDMERLFAATDSRLTGEETSRRHANISHLKAAVAARRADDGPATEARDETGAYREDLASTVKPRRAPRSAEVQTKRPEKPAPLVLVSEQRVADEAPAADTAEPVRPRRAPRVAEADAAEEQVLKGADPARTGEDFEQFAADLGAVDLSDILEAAAVYSAKVMGQDSFSRPRLLHLAAEAADEMSREDGLRGFGKLLRDGTIRKVRRGEFALGDESRLASSLDRRAG